MDSSGTLRRIIVGESGFIMRSENDSYEDRMDFLTDVGSIRLKKDMILKPLSWILFSLILGNILTVKHTPGYVPNTLHGLMP